MDFASRFPRELGAAALVLKAILFSLLGIVLLVTFIVLRRWYRGRYFRRLNQRTFALRAMWDDIVAGRVNAKDWRLDPLDSEIVESILLDSIEVATPEQMPPLLACLRSSGLLDLRIFEARKSRGWKQRTALIALGRTRAPESVPALAEALESHSEETRLAAVRGLGRTGLVEAAVPLLDWISSGQPRVAEHALKNALANCCRSRPSVLVKYLNHSIGPTRELLARVVGELASPDLGDDLLILAADPLPEVRASAARALANAPAALALSVLGALVHDPEWFVRLRAVVSLGSLEHLGRTRVLLRALCDSNRYVRQRAAWALASMEPHLDRILEQVVETEDNYALQAFISELERSGAIEKVVGALEGQSDHYSAQAVLLDALAAGKKSMEVAAAAAAGAS